MSCVNDLMTDVIAVNSLYSVSTTQAVTKKKDNYNILYLASDIGLEMFFRKKINRGILHITTLDDNSLILIHVRKIMQNIWHTVEN